MVSPLFSLLPTPACISVSRETIRSKKKSDYNLSKASAPILTNTTLNVIRLVGRCCMLAQEPFLRVTLLLTLKYKFPPTC